MHDGFESSLKERTDKLLIAVELLSQRVLQLERELEEKDDKMKEVIELNKNLEKQMTNLKVQKVSSNSNVSLAK